ncbi:MAG: flagellar basal-body MS-ring/collar protein FliF [Parasphingorhabdus sp.]
MAEETSASQALEPVDPTAAQPFPANGSWPQSGGILGTIQNFLRQPAIAKAMPLIILSGVIVAAISVWLVLREPAQRDLFRGLPDNDKSAVMQALQSANIAYQVDDMTGALTVSKEDYHTAKIELAGQGLPRTAPSGDSIMSSMPMGASKAVESEKLRSAREMDLARSIEELDNVLSARVHLAVEQPSIFLRDRNDPAASVILQLAGGNKLDERQTQAILNLVASSVPGLSTTNVSVIDQNGRLLSRNDDSVTGENDKHLKIKAAIEDRYRQSLASLLTPIVGPGNFVAEVTADVNFDEKQATSETYPVDGSRLRSERGMKSEEPLGNKVGGIPGALANRPPEAAQFEDQPDGAEEQAEQTQEALKTSEEYQRSFELAREIAVTSQATGQVSRLSVAVAIDDSSLKGTTSAKEIEEIEKLVKGTVGFSAARGDQIAVTTREFKSPAADPAEEAWYESSWFGIIARNLSALLVALLIILGIGRPVLKRWLKSQKEMMAGAANGQLASSGNLALQNGVPANIDADGRMGEELPVLPESSPVTIDMIQAAPSYQERALLTQNFVKQNPDHAALVVKELLKESDSLEEVDG